MATTTDGTIRIGVATVEIDSYGGTFSAPTDLGKTHEDGVIIRYESPDLEIGSAQDLNVLDIFEIGPQKMELEFSVREHKAQHLALSLAQRLTDVTDNTGATPPNTQVNIGGWRAQTYYALRLKTKQIVTPTLFDIITLYRVKFSAMFGQSFTYRAERYIPIKVKCTADSSNSYYYGKIQIEGAAA